MVDAFTELASMIVPEVFRRYGIERSIELDAFLASGIAVNMSDQIEDFGTTVNLPFYKPLAGDDTVADDTEDLSVGGIEVANDIAAKLMRDKVFGSTDLAGELSGDDPMQAIINAYAKYWAERRQAALLATLKGAMAASSMSGNVHDISSLPGSAANFEAESFIDATFKLGDHFKNLSGVAVHSATRKVMEKEDLIETKEDSEGNPIDTYRGKRLIVDDAMPVTTGVYTTYIFGAGAVGFAERARANPVEPGRDPLKNGGRSYIATREQWVMHPRGVKWTPGENVPAAPTPSNAELGTGTNWVRVWQNKNIPIIAFKHKLEQTDEDS